MRVAGRIFLVLPAACWGQPWQIGAGAGYGIYRNGAIIAAAGTATAGVKNRFVMTAVFGEDLYNKVSGEFRYTYQDGDPFLQAGGVKTNIQGQSHAFNYDLLFHARSRGERMRPYAAVGIGGKYYRVAGPENPAHPLGHIGVLRAVNQMKPLITAGGGLQLMLGEHFVLRFDFRDYITPFPSKLIQPAPAATARGIFHQFTPMVGISRRL